MIRRTKGQWVGYYYNTTVNGKRKELPLGSDLETALKNYHDLDRCRKMGDLASGLNWTKITASLINAAKQRAKKGSESCTITASQIIEKLETNGWTCELSGIQFNSVRIAGRRVRPWMPSLDRINIDGGYTNENTRIICAFLNLALNEFGEDIFIQVAKKVIAKQRRFTVVAETISATIAE